MMHTSTIIHEVRRNQALTDKAVQNGVNRAALLSWMLAAILTLSCTMMTLTSCSDNDDTPATLTPEEQLKKDVIGAWIDTTSVELFGYAKFIELRGDQTVDLVIVKPVDNGDGVFDEHDLVETVNSGTWKPLPNMKDRWSDPGEEITLNAIALETKTKDFEQYGTQYDTLLVEKVDDELLCLFTEEVDMLVALDKSGLLDDMDPAATTRSFWDMLKQSFKNIATTMKNTLFSVGKNIVTLLHTLGHTVLKVIEGPDFVRVDPDLSDWMGSTYPRGEKNVKICNISMMGTHDTFTYNMSGILGAVTGKTQKYFISTQWALGVRCFDVRINELEPVDVATTVFQGGHSKLGIYHGPVSLNKRLSSGIEDIVECLKKHKNETAIAILKFENHETDENKREVDKILQEYKDYIVMDPRPGLTLDQCRGKLIIIQRYESPKDISHYIRATGWPQSGRASLVFSGNSSWTEPLYVQDIYEIPEGKSRDQYYEMKKAGLKACFDDSANPQQPDTWHFNHESGYVGVINYAVNAKNIIPWIEDYLDKDVMKDKCAGIVVTDFVGAFGTYDFARFDCTKLPGKVISHNTSNN